MNMHDITFRGLTAHQLGRVIDAAFGALGSECPDPEIEARRQDKFDVTLTSVRDVGGETDPALDSVIGHWSKLTAEQREGVSKAVALLVDVGLDRAFDVAINAAIDAGLLRRCEDPSHRPNAP